MVEKIPLPYPMNALEPYYSEETLRIHYDTLYTGYVNNTNLAQEKLQQTRKTSQFENIKCLEKDLSFYGSGAILHQLFFENMGPSAMPNNYPSQSLIQAIQKDFGSYEIFQKQFTEAAKAVEASRMVFISLGTTLSKVRNFTV